MRHFPSCWNKTLAQLGFRRTRRNVKRKRNEFKRSSRIESLEARQMLTANFDYLVDTLIDELDQSTSDGDVSLRDALYAAANDNENDVDIIAFAPHLAGGTIELDGELNELLIESDVHIVGLGAGLLTIDASGKATDHQRAFSVASGSSVAISNLTVTGGYEVLGGAIYAAEANVTLSDVSLTGNFSTDSGGAIAAVNSTLVLQDSSVIGNESAGSTGGIFFNYNSNSLSNESLLIDSSTIEGNISAGAAGGVRLHSSGGSTGSPRNVQILDSRLSHNQAQTQGGAIFANSGFDFLIDQSTVVDNQALTSHGGGIYVDGSDATIADSQISANQAAAGSGGGIYGKNSGSFEITSSTVSKNVALVGAGIYKVLEGDDYFHVTGSSILSNRAEHDSLATSAAGIYVDGGSSTGNSREFSLVNSTVALNLSRATSATSTVDNTVGAITLNNIAVATIKNSTISSNSAEDFDGAIRIANSGTVTLVNTTITANESLGDTWGAIHSINSTVVAHNTIVADNSSNGPNGDVDLSDLRADSSHNIFGKNVGDLSALHGDGNLKLHSIPELGPSDLGLSELGDHGGPTWTHVPLPGSPAIDAGDWLLARDAYGLLGDQRGFVRLAEVGIDIGSAELTWSIFDNADFNGDGRMDEMRYDTTTGNLSVLSKTTESHWVGSWGVLDPTKQWTGATAGDFNGDGRDDFLVQESISGEWTIALSEGSHFLVQALNLSTNWNAQRLFVGDFDGDGADELLGRATENSNWGLLDYDDPSGATINLNVGASLQNSTFLGNIFVGDANQDGHDDLIASVSPTDAASTADNSIDWEVSLSLIDTNDNVDLQSEQNWNDWFDAHFDNQTGIQKIDADAAYRDIVAIFANAYNTLELELYPGLMKGPEATDLTLAGNPWDQAALLVQNFEQAGISARIVTGQIDVKAEELEAWLGVSTTGAAYSAIASALDAGAMPLDAAGNDLRDPNNPHLNGILATLYAKSIQFNHAWVQAHLPTADGSWQWLDLDPSWKHREQRTPIDISALDDGDGLGIFDEFDYLSLPAGNQQLPLEFFEDQVMQYLASQGLGQSLADLSQVGPIIQQHFETFPTGLAEGVAIVGAITDLGDFDNIVDTQSLADLYTHQVRLAAQRITNLPDYELSLSDLDPISLLSYAGLDHVVDPTADSFSFNPDPTKFISYNPVQGAGTFDYGPHEPSPDTSFDSESDFGFYTGFEKSTTTIEETNVPISTSDQLDSYGIDGSVRTHIDFAGKTLYPILPEQYPTYSSVDFGVSNYAPLAPVNDADLNDSNVQSATIDGLGNQTITLTTSADDPAIASAVDIPDYQITADTRLSFVFDRAIRGSLHGIGWSSVSSGFPVLSSDPHQFFRLTGFYGKQSSIYGHADSEFTVTSVIDTMNPLFDVTWLGGTRYKYEIELGHSEYNFTGTEEISHLVFFTEGDASVGGDKVAQSKFSEISLYDVPTGYDGTFQIPTNATEIVFDSFTTPDGIDIKSLDIPNYQVTENTVLEFDFRGLAPGPGSSHSIGVGATIDSEFETIYTLDLPSIDGSSSQTQTVNLGTELEIPNGSFLDISHLVFTNIGSTGDPGPAQPTTSYFSNISLYEAPLGTATIQSNNPHNRIKLTGSVSKSLDITDHDITESTVLRFDFKSNTEGALHLLGWDTNNTFQQGYPDADVFALYGDDVVGTPAYDGTGWEPIAIHLYGEDPSSLGKIISHLFFTMDGGAAGLTADSFFRNIRFEELEEIDLDGSKQVNPNGSTHELQLTGTTAETLVVPGGYTITPHTVLQFEFSSNSQGEMHRIGWDTNGTYSEATDSPRLYPVFGNQASSLYPGLNGTAYNFYDSIGTDTIQIPIGSIVFDGEPNPVDQVISRLIFTVEGNSLGSSAQSVFKNVSLTETSPAGDFFVDGAGIHLLGTASKSVAGTGVGTHTIREDSWLLFDFSSTQQGALHQIGWEFGDATYGQNPSDEQLYSIYGTSANSGGLYSRYNPGPSNPGEVQTIAIPIGRILVNGNESPDGKKLNRLVFRSVEGDEGIATESVFNNVRLWRPSSSATIHDYPWFSLELNGNSAKTIPIGHYNISDNTHLFVDLNGDVEGLHHAIGVDTDSTYDGIEALFQLNGIPDGRFIQINPSGFFPSDIPLGNLINGPNAVNNIVFLNKSGPSSEDARSVFNEVKLYEKIGPTGALWSKRLSVPEHSLSDISFQIDGSGDKRTSRLYIDGVGQSAPSQSIWVSAGDKASIKVTNTVPTAFGIGQDFTKTYTQNYDEVISLGLDANQFSRDALVAKQADLLAALQNNTDLAHYLNDIDELLSHTVAKYWSDFNRDNAAINQITNTLGIQTRVGSGIAKAKKNLLVDAQTGDFIIEHLPYQIAPEGMGVDLPNGVHFSLNRSIGSLASEAFQLVGYNASALEHNIVESEINSASVSTIQGLRNAYLQEFGVDDQHNLITDDSILVFDRLSTGEVLYRGEWHKDSSFPNQSVTVSDLANLESYLVHHRPKSGGSNEFAGSVWANLNDTEVDGGIRILVPKGKSKVDHWVGSVYLRETAESGTYAIVKEGGEIANGGFSGDVFKTVNTQLPPVDFKFQTFAGDPVNIANGSMFRDEVDIVYPNLGVPLNFARHYVSNSTDDIGLGVGWTHSFGDMLVLDPEDTSTGDLVWITPSGQRHKFVPNGPNFEVPSALHGEFIDTGTLYVYKDKSGMEYHFEQKSITETSLNSLQVVGRLVKQIDNIGNGVEIVYVNDSTRQIGSVRDVHNFLRRLEIEYATDDRISAVHKVDSGLIGTWNFTSEEINGTQASSDFRLTKVEAPQVNTIDSQGASILASPTVHYDYYTTGPSVGLIETITEADGETHDYEYYPNGRVFRVNDADGGVESYTYNLFRNVTEFTNPNGNTEIYIHQDNGLLEKQIHEDRTRMVLTWGEQGTDAEYLMSSSTDEIGATETFTYYDSGDFRRELQQSTSKHFQNADGTPVDSDDVFTTDFTYVQPLDRQHMFLLGQTIIDAGDENITTSFTYDNLGRLETTTDALGNVTLREYYADDINPTDGLLKSETSARGNDSADTSAVNAEYVRWHELSSSYQVNSDTLSVRLSMTNDLDDNGKVAIADAIRLERIDGDFPYSRVIDNDDNGLDLDGFNVTGSLGPDYFYSTGNTLAGIEGDDTGLKSLGTKATWTFTNLQPGHYRVLTTWGVGGNRWHTVPFDIVDGNDFTDSSRLTVDVDQTLHPDDVAPRFITTFSYDAAGNLTQASRDGQPTTVNEYHHTGGILRTTSPPDAAGQIVVSENSYDTLGRLTDTETYPANDPEAALVRSFEYDAVGRVRFSTDELGRITTLAYDARGNLIEQISPDGTSIAFEYDANSNLVRQIDELGRETRSKFDSRDRLINTIFADGASEHIRYTGTGQVAGTTDALDKETVFLYDAIGRLLTTTNAHNYSFSNEFDKLGRLVATTDYEGNRTEFNYDSLGRVIKSRTLPANSAEPLLALTTFDYDAEGNVIRQASYDTVNFGVANSIDDPRSLITPAAIAANSIQLIETQYDVFNRPIEVIAASGSINQEASSNVYDHTGRVVYSYDELGRVSELRYDQYGRLLETVAPDPDGTGSQSSPITRFEYDAVGNQTAIIDPNGNRTVLQYDVFNRVVNTIDALGGKTQTLYDTAGQLVATVDALGRATYSVFDKRGRLTKTRSADPDGTGPLLPSESQFEYDGAGNLLRQIDPRGYETHYEYDDLHRLIKETRSYETIVDSSNSEHFSLIRDNGSAPVTTGYGGNAELVQHDDNQQNANLQTAIAEWRFETLPAGKYRILATWPSSPGGTNVLTVQTNFNEAGFTAIAGESWDQSSPPDDVQRTLDGVTTDWAILAEDIELSAANNTLRLRLRSQAGEDLLADAIRVERIDTREYAYDDNDNLTSETDTLGRITSYTYDELDRIKTVTLPDPDGPAGLSSPQTTTNYDGYGNVTETVEFRGGDNRKTQWTYDTRNRVLSETLDVDGDAEVATEFTYDAAGNLIEQIEAVGEVNARTEYFYDNLNRLQEQVRYRSAGDFYGVTTFYSYDANGNLTESEDEYFDQNNPLNYFKRRVNFTYDALNRETSTTRHNLLQSVSQYDAVGNVISNTDGLRRTTTFAYDHLNRLVSVAGPDPDGNLGSLEASVTTSTYDLSGNLTSQTNGENETDPFFYDRNGRLLSSTDGLGHTAHFTYDSEGNQIAYTDPTGNATTYEYDALNRLTSESITLDSNPASRGYAYSDEGNLDSIIDRNGRTRTFYYDGLDRLTGEFWYDQPGGSLVQGLSWSYDSLGRLEVDRDIHYASGASQVNNYEYDDLGRVTEHRNYDTLLGFSSDAPRIVQRYQYDLITNNTISTVHSQHLLDSQDIERHRGTSTVTFDRQGRVTKITDDADTSRGIDAKLFDFHNDAANQMTGVTRTADGNSVFDTLYGYDNAGRAVNIAHQQAVGPQLSAFSSYQYQYDRAHRITDQSKSLDTSVAALSQATANNAEAFNFDQAGQLTADDAGSYTYDDNGNRTDSGFGVGEHNRLTEDADFTYLYDDEGNLIRRTEKVGGPLGGQVTEYSWDHRNRLVQVVHYDAAGNTPISGTIDYRYNAADQLVWRQETTGGTPKTARHYVFSGDHRVLDIADTGVVRHRFLWGPGGDQLLLDEVYGGSGIQVTEALWAATDHLGSVGQLVEPDGTIYEHREYDSFGDIEQAFDELGNAKATGSLRSHVAHAGSLWDDDAGLYNKRARWYDPNTGRFVGEDPAEDGSNWYQYAGGDPINFRDPTGLTPAGNPLNGVNGGFSGNVLREENTLLRNVASRPVTAGLSFSQIASSGPVNNSFRNIQDAFFQHEFSTLATSKLSSVGIDSTSQFTVNASLDRIVAAQRPFIAVGPAREQFDDPILRGLANPRVQGGLQVVQGVSEGLIAGGLALAPEPTLTTKVAAGVLGAKSFDSIQAGFRQLILGEQVDSFTRTATTNVTTGLGAPDDLVSFSNFLVDAGPSVVGGAALSRTLARGSTGLVDDAARLNSNVLHTSTLSTHSFDDLLAAQRLTNQIEVAASNQIISQTSTASLRVKLSPILETQRDLSILANRQSNVVNRFLQSSDSRVAISFRQAQTENPPFANLIQGRVLDRRLNSLLKRQPLGNNVRLDQTVPNSGSNLRPDVFFPSLDNKSVIFDFGGVSKIRAIQKFDGLADEIIPIVPLERFK